VTGQQFSVLALPLLAAVSLKASPLQMGLLVACETAPFLLLSLPAGVLVDRSPRRPLMVSMNLPRALALIFVPVSALLGGLRLELLYTVAFLVGSFSTFFNVAYQSVLPDLVPPVILNDANSRLETSRAGAEVLGPGLAGSVISLVGSAAALWINAGTFLISALLIGRLPLSERPTLVGRPPPMLGQMREGLAFVWSHPVIRPLMLCATTLNAAQGLLDAVLVLYLSLSLNLTPALIGLVFVGSNVGSVLGALLSGQVAAHLGTGRATVLAALLAGAGMLIVPLAGVAGAAAVPLLMLARFLYGFGNLMFFVQHITLRQSQTPPALQGRMHASVRFLAGGEFPLSTLLGGALAQRFGLQTVLLLAGITGSAAWLWVRGGGLQRVEAVN